MFVFGSLERGRFLIHLHIKYNEQAMIPIAASIASIIPAVLPVLPLKIIK
jgi:hypothetical protein